MKKKIISIILVLMVANASADTISFIGVIKEIKINPEVSNDNHFKVDVNVISLISGESASVFYIHSPSKQLLITEFENTDAYKNKVFQFYLLKEKNQLQFIKAYEAAYKKEECKICKAPLQGFRFGNDTFTYFIYFCPVHGEMNEEWEDEKGNILSNKKNYYRNIID